MKLEEIIKKIKEGSFKFILTNYTANNNLAIMLADVDEYKDMGYIYCDITVNVTTLPIHEVCVDTNNAPFAKELLEKLNIGEDTGKTVQSGFCTYPIMKLDMDKLRPYLIER